MKPTTLLASVLGGLGLVAAACLGYGMAVEQRAFKLRTVRIPILPRAHSPLTILHISDLHILSSQAKKVAWVRTLADLNPDFVINTGDNMASPDSLLALARALTPLADIPGVFVLGSNDFYGPRPVNPLSYLKKPPVLTENLEDPTDWVENLYSASTKRSKVILPTDAILDLFDSAGWLNAEQQRHTFTIKDTTIEVRGCSDAHMGEDDYRSVMGDHEADLLLSVTHAPYLRVLNDMVDDDADIIFAGHTHGGQVCLPGGRALTTNCDLPLAQAKGLSTHHHGDSW